MATQFYKTQQGNYQLDKATGVASQVADIPVGGAIINWTGSSLPSELQSGLSGIGAKTPSGKIITSDDLKQPPNINIPQPKPDTVNYNSMIAGGQATINSVASVVPVVPAVPEKTDLEKRLEDLTKKIGEPPASLENAYQSAYGASGKETAQKELLIRTQAVKTAQAELAGIQAQVQGVIDKRTAQNLILERDSANRGIAGTILNRQQQEVNRQAAIEALPLQALALAAQAKVAGLQGEAEFAQSSLAMAQDKLNTAFKIKSEDAKNLYEYQKEARTAIWDFLSAEQKTRATENQKKDDRAFELFKDQINNAQAIAKTAMDNGQVDIAVKINQLDPKDKDYQQNVADLQKQFVAKPEKPTIRDYEVGGKMVRDVIDSQGKLISRTVLGRKENVPNKLTLNEAKSLGLPFSLVGKSEEEIGNQLLSESIPTWFRELKEQESQMTIRPDILQQVWNDFRNGVLKPKTDAITNPFE